MANEVSYPVRPGSVQRSKLLDGMQSANNALAAGVAVSFPILSLAPGKWNVRWKGEDRIVTVPGHPDIPSPWVDVVIVDVQKDMSRVYYTPAPGGGSSYVQGQRSKPACWSNNGVKPDDSVPDPVNPICATCPKDAWGSGASPASPKAKACQQRRRTVVVPYGDDLTNTAEGGPMLLSVPPGSLTNQAAYRDTLEEINEPYFGIVTRLSYEQKDAKGQSVKYPKVKFDYLRQSDGNPWWLNDEEATTVLGLRNGEAVKRILNSNIRDDGPDTEGGEGDGSAIQGGPQLRPPRAATPPSKPSSPPPPPEGSVPATSPPPPPKPVGGHAVQGITEAVNKPAAPPPSTRPVATAAPPPKLRAVPTPPVEDDGEEEAHAPIPEQSSVFDKLMGDL